MDKEVTITKLKALIKPYVNNVEAFENLTESTDFITDLNINSANLVDIILDVEEAFAITIDNQSMEKMLTINATLEIIETKLSENDRK
jgi:acyl carrier protein